MENTAQLLVSGLASGCVYSLIALGFAMVVRSLNLINFAQGDLAMLGAFFGLTLMQVLHLPYIVAFVVATLLAGAVGYLIERIALRPILNSRAPSLNLVIAVLGLSYVIRSIAILIWKANPVPFPEVTGSQPWHLLGVQIQPLAATVVILGVVTMLVMQLFFNHTLIGVSWRAAALEPLAARLLGIGVGRTISLTFMISAAMGGAAGMLMGPLYYASYNMGEIGLKAFAAAALGGFGIAGALYGGLALGLVEAFAVTFISPGYKDVIAYVVMLAVLMFFYKPSVPSGQSSTERTRAHSVSLAAAIPARWRRLVSVLGVVGLCAWFVAPFTVLQTYAMHIMILAMIYGIAALGLQLVNGCTGQISLGHAAFFGIGAYTAAILTKNYQVPFLAALAAAGLLAALAAGLMAPVMRLRGYYLALATFALGTIVNILMVNLVSVTNGPYGIHGIPSPSIGSFAFDGYPSQYILCSVVLLAVYLALNRLVKFRFGRALVGIRENELAAASVGINLGLHKTAVFMIGSGAAGIAGALYAHFTQYIAPNSFDIANSVNMLIMVVLGGLGSLSGAVFGSFALTMLPEYLRFLQDYRIAMFGVILVFMMVFAPGGFAGLFTGGLRRLLRRVAPQDEGEGPHATDAG